MENYEPGMSFGEETAEIYDDEARGDEEAAVSFLEHLAGGGPALELAIGTGRIALPLAGARDTRRRHRHLTRDGCEAAREARW
jgi:hypothetical protein